MAVSVKEGSAPLKLPAKAGIKMLPNGRIGIEIDGKFDIVPLAEFLINGNKILDGMGHKMRNSYLLWTSVHVALC